MVNSHELKVKIHAAGICGTDMHIIHDEYSCNYPVVLGHEYSGTIVEMGSKVTGFQLGDRVVSLTAAVNVKIAFTAVQVCICCARRDCPSVRE